MIRVDRWGMIGAGLFLVLAGFGLPVLMVMQVIKSTFVLCFLSYGASVAGLFVGLIGFATYGETRLKSLA